MYNKAQSERRRRVIKIDLRSNRPLYEQIIHEIKEDVIKGYLVPGDELPSVRKLAMELSVTPNTVAKAYRELEGEQIIETIRGKGTYISSSMNMKKIDEGKMMAIKKELTLQMLEMMYMGLNEDDIQSVIRELYESIKSDSEI